MFCAAMLMALAVNAATVSIAPGAGNLTAAITAAAAGDIIEMATGTYTENGDYSINKNITIKAAEGATPVIANHYYFKVDGGAQVTFQGVEFDGSGASDHCIRSHNNSTGAEVLTMENCTFHNYPSYVLYTQRNSRKWHALIIRGCKFYANTKHCVAIIYESSSATSCDSVVVENTTFENTTGSYNAVLVQDGNSTKLTVDHCTFYNFGGAFISAGASVTNVAVSNCIFAQPTAGTKVPVSATAGTISNCLSFNTADYAEGPTVTNCITGDPLFADAANGDFTLGANSPALTAGADGGAIGDPRWAPAPVIEYRTVYCSIAAAAGWWKYDAQGQPNYIVAAYAWGGAPAENAAWPGALMEAVEGETDIFKIELDTRYQNIIFTRTSTAGVYQGIKTADLTLPADSNAMYAVTKATYDWSAYTEQLSANDGMWTAYAPHVQVLEDGYYLIGRINGDSLATWTVADLNATRLFEANPAAAGEYMLTATLAAGDELQVVQVAGDAITNWFPGGEGNNYVVDANHAGEKTIYFRPDRQGASDWHQGCIYIAANGTNINNVDADAKAVKLIMNGKVFIRVNGENYTVLGQKVEK